MPATSLVQATKDFKAKQSGPPPDVVLQTVSWDLDTAFVGERITGSTVSRISEYVDRRLEEYSAIHGSLPAVRTPQVSKNESRLTVGVELDRVIGHVERLPPDLHDDHVGHDHRSDQFVRFNVTGLDDAESAQHTDAFVGPEVQADEIEVEKSTDETIRECVKIARQYGDLSGAFTSDGEVDFPGDDGDSENEGYAREDCSGVSVKRIQDATTEGFRINTRGVPRTVGENRVSLFHPLPDPTVKVANHVIRSQYDSSEGWGRRYFREHDGNAVEQSWMYGGNQDTVQDTVVSPAPELEDTRPVSNSILRTQDLREVNNDPMSPTRIKPLHVGMNPYRSPWPWPRAKLIDTTSYITSYDIDHAALKVVARVITAPSSMKLGHEVWFDLCNEPGASDLRAVIHRTVKANLTILMNGRGCGGCPVRGDTEEVALSTLREMISEEAFRRYLKYGFLAVKGQSGDVYQIFRDKHHTKVWRSGKVVEEVCVRIRSEIGAPPTDNVIAFMTMVSADEGAFKKAGNVYKMVEAAA